MIFCLILLSGIGQVFGQLLEPITHPKFVTPLPIPTRIDATGGGIFEMSMEQTVQHLGLFNTAGVPFNTKVRGMGIAGTGGKLSRAYFRNEEFCLCGYHLVQ